MWTPREKVIHRLPVLRSPSIEEAASSRLFSSLTLPSGLALHARTWVPAMVPWRATDAGDVTRDVVDWYGRFADGCPAVVVVEATGIRDVQSGPLLRIGDDRFIDGLRRIVDEVRARSEGRTRLFIQLIDFLRIRRRPERSRFIRQFMAIDDAIHERFGAIGGDAIRVALDAMDDAELRRVLSPRQWEALTMGERERVTDVHLPHIRELPRVLPSLFADAADRAKRAGFDGVELHYAHAYTMASFLSALNDRDDGYGGARVHRARLPLEVLAAVRARVGYDFTVGCRMLCDDVVEGGSGVDDAAYFGVELARAGVDFVSLSTGGRFEDAAQPKVGEAAYPYTGPSGYECMPTVRSDARGPFARNIAKQGRIRAAVRAAGLTTPIVVAGGIATFDEAEAVLSRGDGDVIGAARQSLADPDWFEKLRRGRGDEVRRCTFTNYCEALDQRHRAVTCKLWDRVGLDASAADDPSTQVPTTDGGRRRLIAPGWDDRRSNDVARENRG